MITRTAVIRCAALGFLVLALWACGGKKARNSLFEQRVPQIATVEDAVRMFGPPDADMVQGDGLRRYSWIIYKEHAVQGHEVTVYRRPFWRLPSMMDDYERVYVPAQVDRAYCFFNIFTGDDGDIRNMTWEGNYCDVLLQRNLGTRKMNSLPAERSQQLPMTAR